MPKHETKPRHSVPPVTLTDTSATSIQGGEVSLMTPANKTDIPDYITEQNKQKSDNLSDAKDRAQLTATTAMSVVHVALLKELIMEGPEKVRFFTWNLVLISICIILQVFAGVISLAISRMKVYHDQYHTNICEDFVSNLCCCTFNCHTDIEDEESNAEDSRRLSTDSTKPMQSPLGSIYFPRTKSMVDREKKKQTGACGCLPCSVSTKVYTTVELEVLERYEQWCEEKLDISLQAAEADVHVARLKDIIQEAKLRVSQLESLQHETEGVEQKQEVKNNKAILKEAEHCKKSNQKFIWNKEISRVQGDILWQESKEIREYHLLKAMSFWQGVLNYIFYTVFVLNAFITGLGIAGNMSNEESTPAFPTTNNTG